MIKILKGSRFAVISHRFQQLIPILIWVFRIFSNSRTIMIRSKSTEWKASYSDNQTIGHKKKRGCWFTHFTMKTVITLIQRMESWWWSGRSESEAGPRSWFLGLGFSASIPRSLFSGFGFGLFCFALEIVILREELAWVILREEEWNERQRRKGKKKMQLERRKRRTNPLFYPPKKNNKKL